MKHFIALVVLLCVTVTASAEDVRHQPLKDLNGYFPFNPPESLDQWKQRKEYVRRQILVVTGVWPDKHNVMDNETREPNYEQYPHLFVRLKEVQPNALTASFSTSSPIEGKIVSAADVSRIGR